MMWSQWQMRQEHVEAMMLARTVLRQEAIAELAHAGAEVA